MSVQLNGFVLLFRKFREWEWYTDTKTKAVFLELLLTANFKDGNFQGTPVPRGTVVTSIHHLAAALNLSDKEVRTALKHLKSTGEISIKTTSKFSIITVQNYCLYQDIDNQNEKSRANKRQAKDTQKAGSGQAKGKQRASEGQAKGNNVTKKQCNKETSGGVCATQAHTHTTTEEEKVALPSVTPLGGEPSEPLSRWEWRTYCELKGYNEYRAAEEWIKVRGVFSESQKAKVRAFLKENGEE